MKAESYPRVGETLFRGTLENGLRLRVLQRPGFAKSFALFAADYGGADRRFKANGMWTDTPAGVAHFLEHKLFDMPEGNALSILSANGASPNAFTSSGMTAYHFESTQGFFDNLRVLLNFVSTPYFTQESVAKEQGIIGQEIRMIEDDPDFVVYQNLMRRLFKNHPIRDSVAGSIDSIAEITDRTLYDCHEVFYAPSNMALCVAGDVDPERVAGLAGEILPAGRAASPERDYGVAEPDSPAEKTAEAFMEVSAPLFAFGARFTPGGEPLRERLAGNLAMYCLAGRSSPLYTRLYAEGLINSSFDVSLDFTAGTAVVMISGESRDPKAVLGEFQEQAARLSRDGPPAPMLERALRAMYGGRLRSLGSFSSVCHSLAEGCFAGFEPLDTFGAIESLTAEDARRFIDEKLAAGNIAISTVLPKN